VLEIDKTRKRINLTMCLENRKEAPRKEDTPKHKMNPRSPRSFSSSTGVFGLALKEALKDKKE
jgi:hypothetical protein